MKSFSVQDLTKMSVCVAIICIASYLSFPIPFTTVPFTCQTLAMLLVALVLTPKQTFIVMLVYILIGSIGLPVFAGGASGAASLVSPSGGYLWGFLVAYPISSMVKGQGISFWRYFWAGILSIPIVYAFGIAMICIVLDMNVYEAFLVGALPFIPTGIVKVAASSYIAVHLNKVLLRNR